MNGSFRHVDTELVPKERKAVKHYLEDSGYRAEFVEGLNGEDYSILEVTETGYTHLLPYGKKERFDIIFDKETDDIYVYQDKQKFGKKLLLENKEDEIKEVGLL